MRTDEEMGGERQRHFASIFGLIVSWWMLKWTMVMLMALAQLASFGGLLSRRGSGVIGPRT